MDCHHCPDFEVSEQLDLRRLRGAPQRKHELPRALEHCLRLDALDLLGALDGINVGRVEKTRLAPLHERIWRSQRGFRHGQDIARALRELRACK
eukprot:8431133-Pyramimonas_sp.AAC.1